jgi:hypothetical protein
MKGRAGNVECGVNEGHENGAYADRWLNEFSINKEDHELCSSLAQTNLPSPSHAYTDAEKKPNVVGSVL